MKHTLICFLTIIALFGTGKLWAQQEPEKSPEELAIAEADRLATELQLNATQLFYVDSILRQNYTSLSEEMTRLQERGSQDIKSYTTTKEKWVQKTIDAFQGILDEQQYIRYLKYLGRGQEYKRGKNGIYYKKEDKKKKKE